VWIFPAPAFRDGLFRHHHDYAGTAIKETEASSHLFWMGHWLWPKVDETAARFTLKSYCK
jgi:hypothetical protein